MQLLSLVDQRGISIAQVELNTPSDYRRIGDASILEFEGRFYSFRGISHANVIFQECDAPVNVSGFVRKLPQSQPQQQTDTKYNYGRFGS